MARGFIDVVAGTSWSDMMEDLPGEACIVSLCKFVIEPAALQRQVISAETLYVRDEVYVT